MNYHHLIHTPVQKINRANGSKIEGTQTKIKPNSNKFGDLPILDYSLINDKLNRMFSKSHFLNLMVM